MSSSDETEAVFACVANDDGGGGGARRALVPGEDVNCLTTFGGKVFDCFFASSIFTFCSTGGVFDIFVGVASNGLSAATGTTGGFLRPVGVV